jgi:hypothetical protein
MHDASLPLAAYPLADTLHLPAGKPNDRCALCYRHLAPIDSLDDVEPPPLPLARQNHSLNRNRIK